MSKTAPSLVDTLFEAHVKHEVAALKGAKLKKFLEQEVDELLGYAEKVPLGRLISPEQVMGVIKRIAVNMELDAGIPELAAEMAAEVLKAPVQADTTLGEILSREQASGFIEEALELRQQRERIISEIMAHPVYQELVSNVVYHGLVNYLYEDNLITRSVPGVGSVMKFGKKMANKAVPGLDETFERRIKAWLAESLPGLIVRSEQFLHRALTDDELRDSVMAAWVSLENQTIAELQDGLGEVELQEFVVLGYDFWLNFRKTAYFEGCARAVVEHLFAKYGDRPVMDLLNDIGVTRDVIVTEIAELGLPIIDVLHKEGYVEALVRRRLGSFYKSAAAKKLLAEG
ncbi:hypothetical protein Q666_02155 [Marinobacter sp. ES-1]|uniref:Uncharacterized protein n=1 Tax=Marinobacter vinifirmus TaxID=355591 RepID=A0A7Z1IMF5_9GAMM|nr:MULTISPECIES: hypothetical protein [Marinobacter]ERP91645.1 hypothetical protein Q666_02155 [Marinobacter sp. ES-1]OZC35652.1 hypothetical protein B9Q17_02075 [Marinobacter vinifirmus]